MLEHVHRALDEQRDQRVVQDARGADLGREGGNAHCDQRVGQETGIGRVVEDVVDGKQPAIARTSGRSIRARWNAVASMPEAAVWKSSA